MSFAHHHEQALLRAIAENSVAALRSIGDRCASFDWKSLRLRRHIDDMHEEAREPILTFALAAGAFDVALELIQKDLVDINEPDDQGTTPLMMAIVVHGQPSAIDVFRVLLDHPDLVITNIKPLAFACHTVFVEGVERLLQRPDVRECLGKDDADGRLLLHVLEEHSQKREDLLPYWGATDRESIPAGTDRDNYDALPKLKTIAEMLLRAGAVIKDCIPSYLGGRPDRNLLNAVKEEAERRARIALRRTVWTWRRASVREHVQARASSEPVTLDLSLPDAGAMPSSSSSSSSSVSVLVRNVTMQPWAQTFLETGMLPNPRFA